MLHKPTYGGSSLVFYNLHIETKAARGDPAAGNAGEQGDHRTEGGARLRFDCQKTDGAAVVMLSLIHI